MPPEQHTDLEHIREWMTVEATAMRDQLKESFGEEALWVGIGLTKINGQFGLAFRIQNEMVSDAKAIRSKIEELLTNRNAVRMQERKAPIGANIREIGKIVALGEEVDHAARNERITLVAKKVLNDFRRSLPPINPPEMLSDVRGGELFLEE